MDEGKPRAAPTRLRARRSRAALPWPTNGHPYCRVSTPGLSDVRSDPSNCRLIASGGRRMKPQQRGRSCVGRSAAVHKLRAARLQMRTALRRPSERMKAPRIRLRDGPPAPPVAPLQISLERCDRFRHRSAHFLLTVRGREGRSRQFDVRWVAERRGCTHGYDADPESAGSKHPTCRRALAGAEPSRRVFALNARKRLVEHRPNDGQRRSWRDARLHGNG